MVKKFYILLLSILLLSSQFTVVFSNNNIVNKNIKYTQNIDNLYIKLITLNFIAKSLAHPSNSLYIYAGFKYNNTYNIIYIYIYNDTNNTLNISIKGSKFKKIYINIYNQTIYNLFKNFTNIIYLKTYDLNDLYINLSQLNTKNLKLKVNMNLSESRYIIDPVCNFNESDYILITPTEPRQEEQHVNINGVIDILNSTLKSDSVEILSPFYLYPLGSSGRELALIYVILKSTLDSLVGNSLLYEYYNKSLSIKKINGTQEAASFFSNNTIEVYNNELARMENIISNEIGRVRIRPDIMTPGAFISVHYTYNTSILNSSIPSGFHLEKVNDTIYNLHSDKIYHFYYIKKNIILHIMNGSLTTSNFMSFIKICPADTFKLSHFPRFTTFLYRVQEGEGFTIDADLPLLQGNTNKPFGFFLIPLGSQLDKSSFGVLVITETDDAKLTISYNISKEIFDPYSFLGENATKVFDCKRTLWYGIIGKLAEYATNAIVLEKDPTYVANKTIDWLNFTFESCGGSWDDVKDVRNFLEGNLSISDRSTGGAEISGGSDATDNADAATAVVSSVPSRLSTALVLAGSVIAVAIVSLLVKRPGMR